MRGDKLVVIAGPTASGKTDAGIAVALRFGGEIISADSIQFYKGFDIGSAKPSAEQLAAVPHHFIGEIDPAQEFNAAIYQKLAQDRIADIRARGKLPIVVGGSGLYVSALTGRLDFTQAAQDAEYRSELEKTAKERGSEALHDILAKVDPETAARLHPNDTKRIIRALEVYKVSGVPMSAQSHGFVNARAADDNEYIMLGLTMPREKLYARINSRVDKMMAAGFEAEVRGLLKSGVLPDSQAMQGLGYRQLCRYIAGECTLEKAVDDIKRETRRFAKRQYTWFRRDGRIRWFDLSDYSCLNALYSDIIDYISKKLQQ